MRSAEELGAVVVAESGGRPVHLDDVARVVDGPEEPSSLRDPRRAGPAAQDPAVTLAVSKRRGANAIAVVHAIERKLEALRPAAHRRATSARR